MKRTATKRGSLLPAITPGNSVNTLKSKREKIDIIVQVLRTIGSDDDILNKKLYIPDQCEKYGFKEGYHNMGELLYFLGDMIEE